MKNTMKIMMTCWKYFVGYDRQVKIKKFTKYKIYLISRNEIKSPY